MELWQVIVAVIQGLVEWLPISSEGQVVLFVYNFGSVPPEDLVTLAVWLHLGTAIAVLARYPRVIIDVLTLKDRRLFKLLLIATVCTAVIAIPFYMFLRNSIAVFHGEMMNMVVGILLLATAVILYLPTRTLGTEESNDTVREVGNQEAVATGLLQGLAVLPGLSRSGVTVSALLMQRVDKETALRFSFLLSVPAVLGILAFEVLIGGSIPASMSVVDLALAEVIVFIIGLGSMEFLLRLARTISFWKLCLVLACVAIVFGIPALF
ncbi:MAG: undecaprenyl-diphosphate phosphatase [Candidatus Thorarchaeota archaeon]